MGRDHVTVVSAVGPEMLAIGGGRHYTPILPTRGSKRAIFAGEKEPYSREQESRIHP